MPTPRFLTLEDILRLHTRQIERFGGSSDVRDMGLLESAIAQPAASFSGELLHPTLPAQAAAYLYHIAKNHPFIDGNKRTAFAVADVFIRINRFRLSLSPSQVYELVIQVAQSDITKTALTERLEETIVPKNSG
ncbi:type II toxin-antitoxin system death-on-curing family toxin [filamentous cyanobacterium LEGE 11480]|uniref:Type II toxin-antitoxin system death-on-curing family toxin n=1 Tax=Romeriopsis navalis LEGE 11480 TaxID=2777977 RepID=A0A928Z4F4_9CYAN|nr:type II toxin-antitoxin system death-on-curing family toxin [Romeriopsis navalis]MBE9031714.1 type II toxin-antitoxin system death-on-curing family toxin [Romeriopsis navalis LEGE 11480]